MSNLVKQSKKKYINLSYIFPMFLLLIIIAIIINPTKYTSSALNGLEVWVKVLVPALFPFFVLTKLFSSCGLTNDISNLFAPITKKLYKCPSYSSYIFFMSIITGYPVGAKMVSDYYNNGSLTKNEAIKTLSFCCNSGPMFILGSVAIGMFNNFKLGIIIYISHILGSLFNGLLYRNYNHNVKFANDENEKQKSYIKKNHQNSENMQRTSLSNNINFSESISSSVNSILLIGGVICFTFVLIEFITTSKIFELMITALSNIGLNKSLITAFFSGILEITKGSLMFSSIPMSFYFIAPICTFIITFGGVSTILQAMAFTKNIIPTKLFILQKFTHAILATIFSIILSLFLI